MDEQEARWRLCFNALFQVLRQKSDKVYPEVHLTDDVMQY